MVSLQYHAHFSCLKYLRSFYIVSETLMYCAKQLFGNWEVVLCKLAYRSSHLEIDMQVINQLVLATENFMLRVCDDCWVHNTVCMRQR